MSLTTKYTEEIIKLLHSIQVKINASSDICSINLNNDQNTLKKLNNEIGEIYINEILKDLHEKQITGITSFSIKGISDKTVFLTLKGFDLLNNTKPLREKNKVGF